MSETVTERNRRIEKALNEGKSLRVTAADCGVTVKVVRNVKKKMTEGTDKGTPETVNKGTGAPVEPGDVDKGTDKGTGRWINLDTHQPICHHCGIRMILWEDVVAGWHDMCDTPPELDDRKRSAWKN